jgi:sec-independent protein translocase protein TatC
VALPILVERRQLLAIVGQVDPTPNAPTQMPLIVAVRPLDAAPLVECVQEMTHPPLRTFGVVEPCFSYLQVSLYSGVVLASPWILYQLWVFVAAGLYPHEKRRVYLYLPLSIALFLAGVCLCEFVVLPMSLEYLLSFNEWLGFEPELRLSEWLGFATLMPLVFGGTFQTPLVMIALNRIGLVSVETYRRQRRLAFFLLAVLAAILTITPDWVNMLALTVPLYALYELGIVLCRLGPTPAPDIDEPVHEPFAEV